VPASAADYFTLPQPAPYMSTASGVTDLTRDPLSAIVHVNGTARVQTVTRTPTCSWRALLRGVSHLDVATELPAPGHR
jgi:carbamoyltransferase